MIDLGHGRSGARAFPVRSWREPNCARRPGWPNLSTDAWAKLLLIVMMLYVLVGLPWLPRSDANGQTDAIDPFNHFIWLGLLGLALPLALSRWRSVSRLARANWPILALYGYFLLSVSWALDPQASARRLLFSLVQLALCLVLLRSLRRPAALVPLLAGCVGLNAVLQLSSCLFIPERAMAAGSFVGLAGQKNQAGLLFMYGCLACGALLVVRRDLKRVAGLGLALNLGLLLASRSFTSEIATGAAAIGLSVTWWGGRSGAGRLALAAGIFGITALAATGLILTLAASTIGTSVRDLTHFTAHSRLDIWRFVISEIAKRPLLGAGYQSFWAISPDVQPSLQTDQWFSRWVVINEGHQGYLDLMATGGLLGFSGAAVVLLRGFVLALRAFDEVVVHRNPSGGLTAETATFHLGLLIALALHNLGESNLFTNNATLNVVLLITLVDLERWRVAAPSGSKARPRFHSFVKRARELPTEPNPHENALQRLA